MGAKMPLSDPTKYVDKSEDWMDKFRQLRAEQLLPLVTDELVEAHRRNPRGPHCHELNLVLNFVRGPAYPMDDKPFVYLKQPYDEYGLAQMTGRGLPAKIIDDELFTSETEAIHGAFLQRLRAHNLDKNLTYQQGSKNV
jgi:branched-chain amino acid transport system permease protein